MSLSIDFYPRQVFTELAGALLMLEKGSASLHSILKSLIIGPLTTETMVLKESLIAIKIFQKRNLTVPFLMKSPSIEMPQPNEYKTP